MVKKIKIAIFMIKIRLKVCWHFGRVRVRAILWAESLAYYIALLIYTMQARSTANGNIRREIHNRAKFDWTANQILDFLRETGIWNKMVW
jgi:hypothetical protein